MRGFVLRWTWLAPGEVPQALLKPYPAERMTGWRVPDEAHNPRAEDRASLIERRGEVWQAAG